MEQTRFRIDNGDGWRLELRRFRDPETRDESRRPVVAIPGYCMNCFILNYHPNEPPLIEYLVDGGLEVWAAHLRGQGGSERVRGSTRYGFSELALVDLPAIFDFVLDRRDESDAVDIVGCSMGASMAYAYLGHHAEDHRVGAMVNIGGPLRWTRVHPLLRLAVQSPGLLGMVPVRGTRRLARWAIPIVERCPWILSHYVNADIVDLSEADRLVQTIDDPNPRVSLEMARWIKNRDLVVDGLDIGDALSEVDVPLQCIIAMQDGIVTPESALSVVDPIGSTEIEIVEVGSRETPHAHADLFVSEGVGRKVFAPLRRWLARVG